MRTVSCDGCGWGLVTGDQRADNYAVKIEIGDAFDAERAKRDLCRACTKLLMQWFDERTFPRKGEPV